MIKLIIDSNKNLKKAATSKVFVGENEFEEITVSCNRRVLVNNIPDFSASLRVVIGENELSYPLAFSDTDSNTMTATVLIDTRMTRAVAELQFYVKFNSGEKVGMTNAIKIECNPNIESGDEPYIPPIPLDDHVPKSQTIAGIDQYDAITADELKEALDLDDKMDLAPLNPTAKQIEDMPNGQLYGDDNSHKGIIKDGQEFYDTFFVNDRLIRKITNERGYTRPPAYIPIDSSVNDILRIGNDLFRGGDYGGVWYLQQGTSYVTVDGELTHYYRWKRLSPLRHINNQSLPPELEPFEVFNYYYLDGILIEKVWLSPKYQEGDYYYYNGERYICSSAECEFRFVDGVQKGVYVYNWIPITVPTKISAFTNDSGYLTLETLPIYDGTVI